MEALDLARHEPEAFEGKSVTVDGRTYRIGERFREGSQGHAHELQNLVSGLSLHAIQVRQSYRADPESARQASKLKEVATADLRTKMAATEPSVSIPILRYIEGHGGCFELHELGFPWSGKLPEGEAIRHARSLHESGNHRDAANELRMLLEQHPNHTVALALLASFESAAGRHNEALSANRKAIDIEPNLAEYRGQRILLTLRGTRPRAGIEEYEEFLGRYPLVHDYDAEAVQGLLRCGRPERALEVLRGGGVYGDLRVQLQEAAELSNEGRKRAQALLAPVHEAMRTFRRMDEQQLLDRLKKAHEADPDDPVLMANLGFALRRDGEPRQAAGLLLAATGAVEDDFVPYCWANAAFCFIAVSEWANAMHLLDATLQGITARGQDVSPADAPGVAEWIMGHAVIESASPFACEIVDRAIAECPDPAIISNEVRRLAVLYQQARALIRDAKERAPAAAPVEQAMPTPPPGAPWWRKLRSIGGKH